MTPLRTLVAASLLLVQAWSWATASSAVGARYHFCAWLALATPFLICIALSPRPRGVLFVAASVVGGAASAILRAQRLEDGVGFFGGFAAWHIALAACLFTTWVLLPIGIASFVPWLHARKWSVLVLMVALVVTLERSGVSIGLREDVINQGAANGRLTEDAVPRVHALYVLTAVALALSLPRELMRTRGGTHPTRAARVSV